MGYANIKYKFPTSKTDAILTSSWCHSFISDWRINYENGGPGGSM